MGPVQPLRVVIADDHPFYRNGLVRSLRASGIDVVAEAPNGEAAIRAVDETAPDVVVMDLKMPVLSGLEATRRLTERAPASRVLMLSVSTEEADLADAITAGATGYVLKDQPVEEVVEGIRSAASGEPHISPAIATLQRRRFRGPAMNLHLSPRELDVLDLLVEGGDEREIAEILEISPTAVRGHASSILTKLVRTAVRTVHRPGA
jgi:DNA-binding NarL/FixJ family response regulator